MTHTYQTNDPKGWCGDPQRGAALGRADVHDAERDAPLKLRLQKVRLDNGGYDVNGTYWGRDVSHSGDYLRRCVRHVYWYADADGSVDGTLRATDREEAKGLIRARYPNARFFR